MSRESTKRLEPPRSDSGDLNFQAREWLAYIYSGEATDEGKAQFSAWLKSSKEHVTAYKRTEQVWRDCGFTDGAEAFDIGLAGDDTVVELPFDERRALQRDDRIKEQSGRGWMAIAAVLLVAVMAGLWQFNQPAPVGSVHYASEVGEIKTVELADGSAVTLSGASSMTVRYSDDQRYVMLEQGGAWFDVKANADAPFSVNAGNAIVRVLGTSFDVQLGDEDVEVSVGQGLVEVGQAATAGVRLAAGERVLAASGGGLSDIVQIDPEKAFSWRSGRLVYFDERLSHVLAEVNRFRDKPIVVANSELADMRVSASFRIDETDKLLSFLQAASSVTVVDKPESVSLSVK